MTLLLNGTKQTGGKGKRKTTRKTKGSEGERMDGPRGQSTH